MPPSSADQELLADMRQREFQLKKRQLAANAITYETKRYRGIVLAVVALLVAFVATGVLVAVDSATEEWPEAWRTWLLVPVFAGIFGALLGQLLLGTRRGRRLIAGKERRLRRKYSGDLHAGRRWMSFHYDGEDISAYVPQVLYAIDSEQRFDSVEAALDYVRDHDRPDAVSTAGELERFDEVAAQTNVVVVASVDATGQPSIRIMRFVTTDRPGVWYVTTAPDSRKVQEFELGRLAVMTPPTQTGATISSNRLRIRRAATTLGGIAHLYDAQVPGFLDGITEAEQERELVYELTLQSARVDTWVTRDVVVFDVPSVSDAEAGGPT